MIIERMIGTVNEDVHGPCVAIGVRDLLDVLSIIERVSVYCQTNPNAAGLARLWASDVDAYEIYTWTDALAAGLRRLVPVTPVTARTTPTADTNLSVRNDTATIHTAMILCPQCGATFKAFGRRQWCCDACRQSAWRRRRSAPRPVLPTRNTTIYECPHCDTRYHAQQRCEDCNSWCRRVGPGGTWPHCDQPVAITDLIDNP